MIEPQASENNTSSVLDSEIVALARADDVSFDKIKQKHGLSEKQVINLMRTHLKPRSFKLWRASVSGRKTKHRKLLKAKERLILSSIMQENGEV